ncbi:expressed unknown protein [Seminavis robusta]|uniref:Uncharacterized protein n=1 Tax=Seminavis robusta TaxID=568900 RepID=A0A9N8H9W9_9STRA|nr:expressed unknown protein [Seminavis robusta]|eukprot:Sro220_g090750.1 n/a (2029) ;mRNA; f:54810-60896
MPTTQSVKARLRSARERRTKKIHSSSSSSNKNPPEGVDAILWDAMYPHGTGPSSSSASNESKRSSSPDDDRSTTSTYSGTSSHSKPSVTSSFTSNTTTTTALCQLLWARQWEASLQLLLQGNRQQVQQWCPLPCFGQNATGLPLHLVCAMRPLPPVEIVRTILQKYPEAAQQKASMWGLVPLHLAVDLRSSGGTTTKKQTTTKLSSLKSKAAAVVGWSSHTNKMVQPQKNHHHQRGSDIVPAVASSDSSSSFSSSTSITSHNIDDNLSSLGSSASSTAHQQHPQSQEDDMTNHSRIIVLLLDVAPQALTMAEEFHGMLPLHIAVSSTPAQGGRVPPHAAQILQLLATTCPATLHTPDHAGDTPVKMAQRGHGATTSDPSGSSSRNSGSHTTSTVLSPQTTQLQMVSHLPDWKWNPILYPNNQDQTDVIVHNNNSNSTSGAIKPSKNQKIASLLVGSLDDLISTSSSSSSSSSASSSSSGDDANTDNGIFMPTPGNSSSSSSAASLSDNDDLSHEIQQLHSYESDLRKELEESIRLHCPIPVFQHDNNKAIHSSQPVQDGSKVTADTETTMTASYDDDVSSSMHLFRDDGDDDDDESMAMVMMTMTSSSISAVSSSNEEEEEATAADSIRTTALYSVGCDSLITTATASYHDVVTTASLDQDLEDLESNLRHELKTAKSYASFLRYSFENGAAGHERTTASVPIEETLDDKLAVQEATTTTTTTPDVQAVADSSTDKAGHDANKNTPMMRQGENPCVAVVPERKDPASEELVPVALPNISNSEFSIAGTSGEEEQEHQGADKEGCRAAVEDPSQTANKEDCRDNEDDESNSADWKLTMSFALTRQNAMPAMIVPDNDDVWDEIPLSESAKSSAVPLDDGDTAKEDPVQDFRRHDKIFRDKEEPMVQSMRMPPRKAKSELPVSRDNFPSIFYGLPSIQEANSQVENEEADAAGRSPIEVPPESHLVEACKHTGDNRVMPSIQEHQDVRTPPSRPEDLDGADDERPLELEELQESEEKVGKDNRLHGAEQHDAKGQPEQLAGVETSRGSKADHNECDQVNTDIEAVNAVESVEAKSCSHDLVYPPNAEAVLDDDGDVLIVWERIAAVAPSLGSLKLSIEEHKIVSESCCSSAVLIQPTRFPTTGTTTTTHLDRQDPQPVFKTPTPEAKKALIKQEQSQTEPERAEANCSSLSPPLLAKATSADGLAAEVSVNTPPKSGVQCASNNLTQLTEELQRLQAENESHILEMERLKKRVSIITEIKGVNYEDLRRALQDVCKQDKSSRSTASSVSSPLSALDVLDEWHQELNADAEEGVAHPFDEQRCPSTPSLSPPRIIKTNDGIGRWFNTSPCNPDDALPVSENQAQHQDRFPDTCEAVLDLEGSLGDWCDELLAELAATGGRKDASRQSGIEPQDEHLANGLKCHPKSDTLKLYQSETSTSDSCVPTKRSHATPQDKATCNKEGQVRGKFLDEQDRNLGQHLGSLLSSDSELSESSPLQILELDNGSDEREAGSSSVSFEDEPSVKNCSEEQSCQNQAKAKAADTLEHDQSQGQPEPMQVAWRYSDAIKILDAIEEESFVSSSIVSLEIAPEDKPRATQQSEEAGQPPQHSLLADTEGTRALLDEDETIDEEESFAQQVTAEDEEATSSQPATPQDEEEFPVVREVDAFQLEQTNLDDEEEKSKRKRRLRELVQCRKSQRPFLDAEEVIKKLFPTNLENPNTIYRVDLLDQTFEDIWKCALEQTGSDVFSPPSKDEIASSIIIYDPRCLAQAISSQKMFVLSGAMEEIVVNDLANDLMEEESSSSDTSGIVASIGKPKRAMISLNDEHASQDRDFRSSTPEETTPPIGCCALDLGDLWACIEATDAALAKVGKMAEEAQKTCNRLFGCGGKSEPQVSPSSMAASTRREQENLAACNAQLRSKRRNLDEKSVSAGLLSFMDQLIDDVEETIFGLSRYSDTLSRREKRISSRQEVETQSKVDKFGRKDDETVTEVGLFELGAFGSRIPIVVRSSKTSSVGGSTITDLSIKRSGWL